MTGPDIHDLTPLQVSQAVNAVRGGTIRARQVEHHVHAARFALGRGRRISLILYAAWLRRLLEDGRLLKGPSVDQTVRMRERRAEARDIGPVPEAHDPERREACRLDLERHLRTYLPESFSMPFGPMHRRLLRKSETAVLRGGLFAEAAPRGGGKSTIARGVVSWAVLHGHRFYVPLVAAELGHAKALLDGIKRDLESPEIARDFPEVALAIAAIDGNPQRALHLTCERRPCHFRWGTESVVLPRVPAPANLAAPGFVPGSDSPSAEAVIEAEGLLGSIRGKQHVRSDGPVVRPDFVFLDDPQTRESARSPTQCDYRENVITGDVLGLGGHTKQIAAVMPCTVIEDGDLADRFTDQELHPEWQGERMELIERWADRHDDLWMEKYAAVRRQPPDTVEGGIEEIWRRCNEFYRKHRRQMDAGCRVFWEHGFDPATEVSAIQHAYNLLVDRGTRVFFAEYQNRPLGLFDDLEEPPLESHDVLARMNGLARYVCPSATSVVTAFIDAGSRSHVHWVVAALGDGFTGAVIDYGWRRVERRARGGREAAVRRAVEQTAAAVCSRLYPVEGGGELRVTSCFRDSGWMTGVIYDSCRTGPHAAITHPSKGQGGELMLRPPKDLPAKDLGAGWYRSRTGKDSPRPGTYLVIYDVDYYKTLAEERLRTPLGGRGCVSIWGEPGKLPAGHVTLAEQLCSEYRTPKKKATGDQFDKWGPRPGKPANHLWDCLVGCLAAGAREGIVLDDIPSRRRVMTYRARPASGGPSGGWQIGRG